MYGGSIASSWRKNACFGQSSQQDTDRYRALEQCFEHWRLSTGAVCCGMKNKGVKFHIASHECAKDSLEGKDDSARAFKNTNSCDRASCSSFGVVKLTHFACKCAKLRGGGSSKECTCVSCITTHSLMVVGNVLVPRPRLVPHSYPGTRKMCAHQDNHKKCPKKFRNLQPYTLVFLNALNVC